MKKANKNSILKLKCLEAKLKLAHQTSSKRNTQSALKNWMFNVHKFTCINKKVTLYPSELFYSLV